MIRQTIYRLPGCRLEFFSIDESVTSGVTSVMSARLDRWERNTDKDELFDIIKKAVREVVQEEMGRTWLGGLATVTDEEQEDIDRCHGKPDRPRKIESRETVDL